MSWTSLHLDRGDDIRRAPDPGGYIAFYIGDGIEMAMPREVAERLRDALNEALGSDTTPPFNIY